ncbi:hypothetical protein Tco_0744248 [Tanacetum coccineum]
MLLFMIKIEMIYLGKEEDDDEHDDDENDQEDDDARDDDKKAEDDDDEEMTESDNDGSDEDDSSISSSDEDDSDNDVEGAKVAGAKSGEDATDAKDQGNEATISPEFKAKQFIMRDALISIPGTVDQYLANKMQEAVDVAVQLKYDRFREESTSANQQFLDSIDEE